MKQLCHEMGLLIQNWAYTVTKLGSCDLLQSWIDNLLLSFPIIITKWVKYYKVCNFLTKWGKYDIQNDNLIKSKDEWSKCNELIFQKEDRE